MANANATTTTITVTNLAELTAAKGPFAGCAIIGNDHTLKGDLKGRAYVALPFTKANLLAKLSKFANLESIQTANGFGIVLKGTGGRTAKDDADALQIGLAEIMSVSARLDALRAKLGDVSDTDLGEIMRRFDGKFAQAILAMLARADVMTSGGLDVTRESLRKEPRSKVPAK